MEKIRRNTSKIHKIVHISSLPIWIMSNSKGGMPTIYKCLKFYDNIGINQWFYYTTTEKHPITTENNIRFIPIKVFAEVRKPKPIWAKRLGNRILSFMYFPLIGYIHNIIKEIKPDIIYVHLPYLLYPTLPIARILNIPVFLRLYGTTYLYRRVFITKDYWKNLDYIIPFKLPLTGYIFTNDGSGTDKIAKYFGIPSHRILHLPNGVDKNPHTKKEGESFIRKKYNIKSNQTVGLFVSRLERNKGVDKLEYIIRNTPEIKWIVVGEGTYFEYFKRLNLSNAIFTGSIPFELINLYYKGADFFLSLNDVSILCNPVLEALESEIPVIALNRGIGVEFLKKVVITGNNEKEITEIINKTIKDIQTDNYIKKIKEWKEKHLYTWDKRYQKEYKFIKELI